MVVVGAGPYGLSLAAHLRAAGLEVRVFGEVMDSWRHEMATGMFLKSTPKATDLSAPVPGGRLSDFCRETGRPPLTELTPIPCEVFARYGIWFARRFAGEVESRRVSSIQQATEGFTVCLEDGERIEAAAVVLATGLSALCHIPRELLPLAPEGPGVDAVLSHSSQQRDLSRYAGRRVVVVGGGQSALESAALLHEAGAGVNVLVRADRVRWGAPAVVRRPLRQRLAHPDSPLGAGWALTAVCLAPSWVRLLPARKRLWLHRRALGPSGSWWLRDRVENIVPLHLQRRVTHARRDGATAHLTVGGGEGPAELRADHVVAATGYRIDVDALHILAPDLRRTIARVPGSAAPHLSASLQSTVPGLYFAGTMAAPTFGPMLRFVAGTRFAAERITRSLRHLATLPRR
ncbi:FAD-dependent oxidoreductase [Nonomuraea sp. bgisy101]|uniref:FAD-dependent oxidoreductase n=1 Tax=Nonomuraea sp. bgisy101 TaxID=3413784 RepID=UPI003D756A93